VAEGYESLTVPRIRREAGVSRRSFDACFRGVADCFLAAVEARITMVVRRAETEARRADSWGRTVVRIVSSLSTAVSRDPGLVRLAFLEILAPGPEGLAKSEQIVTYWARRLCRSAPVGSRPDPFAAEASVAAAWPMAQCEFLFGRGDRIGEMTIIVLAPAIGPAAAERTIRAESDVPPAGR
jgi:AcrR family transcriptional regulator